MASDGDASLDIANWEELNVDLGDYDNLETALDLSIRVTGTAQFVWLFDESALRTALMGLPKEQYKEVFLDFPSIDKAEVKIRPFWKNSFPRSIDRILIKSSLEA